MLAHALVPLALLAFLGYTQANVESFETMLVLGRTSAKFDKLAIIDIGHKCDQTLDLTKITRSTCAYPHLPWSARLTLAAPADAAPKLQLTNPAELKTLRIQRTPVAAAGNKCWGQLIMEYSCLIQMHSHH